jgi:acyl dehydratase
MARVRDAYGFVVEPAKIREFAAATWDGNPAFFGQPAPGVQVPLTFLGAAGQMSGRPHPGIAAGIDVSRSFHGEERIVCTRVLRPGEELAVRVEGDETGVVHGRRGGAMRRILIRSEMRAASDDLVATVERTILECQEPVAPRTDLDPSRLASTDPGLGVRADPLPPAPEDPRALRSGAVSPTLVVGPVTRTDFVRYAGASGDFTAIHFDEVVAAEAGFPAPFGMGMLSAGILGHLLSDWICVDTGYDLRIRFVSPVFPGDVIRCSGRVTQADHRQLRIEATASCAEAPLTTATLVLPRQGRA